jgi:hypothetical protein
MMRLKNKVDPSDPAVQSDLSAIAEMHKSAKTHKEKAELETWIREKIGWHVGLRPVVRNLGILPGEMEVHRTFTLAGTEFIWTLLDEKNVSLHTVQKLLYDAKARSKLMGVSVDTAIRDLYEERASDSSVCKTRKGKVTFKRHTKTQREKSVKFAWTLIRDAVREIIKREMKQLDPIMHDRLMRDLDIDLKVLVHQYKTRVNSNVKNGIPVEDRGLKRKFMGALSNLDLPKPEKAITQEYATKIRREFRRKLADHHPDRYSDSNQVKKDHIKARFQEMQEVYQIVEDYLTSHGVQAALK